MARSPGELGEPATGRGALRFLWIDAGQTAAILWLLAAAVQLTTGWELIPLGWTAAIGVPAWFIVRAFLGSGVARGDGPPVKVPKLPPPP